MKKLAILFAAAAMLLTAANANAQLQVGAGYLNSTLTSTNADPANTNGFYAGFSYNIPIVAGLGVAPGLYYSMLGGKSTGSASLLGLISTSTESKFTEQAVNLPVYLNWGMNLTNDFKFFVFAGPTVQYGLTSKTNTSASVSVGSHDSSSDNTIDNYAHNYNRLNVYLGGGLGMNAGPIQITVGYDYGMMNLYTGNGDTVMKRSNIKIGAAYLF